MEIEIFGFRCYKNQKLSLPQVQTILLQGASGVGKSTIFSAIYWCLYGSLKNIYPRIDEIKKKHNMCYVQIRTNNLIIYRQANPKLFKFTNSTGVYQDEVAQNLINQIYGTKEIWLTCCYLEQGSRCLLLSGSNQKKMSILNSLAFFGEDPQQYKDSIVKSLKEKERIFLVEQGIYNNDLSKYNSFVSEYQPDMKYYLDQDGIDIKKKYLNDVIVYLNSLNTLNLQQQEKKGIKSEITKELLRINEELDNIYQYDDNTLKQLSDKIVAITTWIDFSNTLESIQRARNELGDISLEQLDPVSYTEDEYNKILELETYVNINKSITDEIGIEYNESEIISHREKWSYILKSYDLNQSLYEKKKIIESNLESLIEPNVESIDEKIYTQDDYNKLSFQEKTYENNLNIANECGVLYNEDDINTKHTQCSKILQLLSEHKNLSIELDKSNTEIENIRSKIKPYEDLNYNKSDIIYSDEDYYRTKNQEEEYYKQKSKVDTYHIEYDMISIQSRVNQLENILKQQENLPNKFDRRSKKINLEKELALNKVENNPIDEIDKIKNRIRQLEASRNVLSCPHCKGNIRLENHKLVVSDIEFISDQVDKEILELTRQLNHLTNQYNSYNKRLQIISILSEYQDVEMNLPELLSHQEISKIKLELSELQYVNIVDIPNVSSEYIYHHRSYTVLLDQYNKIKDKNSNIIDKIEQVNRNLSDLSYDPTKDYNYLCKLLNRIQYIPKPEVSSEYILGQINHKIWREKRSNLIKELEELNKNIDVEIQFNLNEINEIRKKYTKIQNVKYYQISSVSSKHILEQIKLRKTFNSASAFDIRIKSIITQMDDIRDKVSKYPTDDFTNESIERMRKELDQMRIKISRKNLLIDEKKEKEKLLEQIIIDPTIESKIKEYTEIQDRCQYLILEGEKSLRMKKELDELTRRYDYINKLCEELTGLERLKQSAIDVECKLLQATVNQINNALSEILPSIFDSSITVMLSLYRDLKSKKGRTKAEVNLTICYKNVEYDNVNQMSGGEGDRVSLAILIALNKVSPSPILLIDEALSSLDQDLKTKAIISLKENLPPSKTVLCVDHGTVEGYYDHTIYL